MGLFEGAMATQNPRRLYKAWRGSNVFLCGGRLIFGPDASSILLTAVLISSPSIAFCCQTILEIDHRRNHLNGDQRSSILCLPVLIVAVVATILDLVFLLLTSSRDPGIIPKSAQPPEQEEAAEGSSCNPSMDWVHGRSHMRMPRTKDVIVNGFVVKIKYCDTCLLYRLPRSSHCSICNNCVQRFDHHCPWVGQCIGLRNYRFFFMFISSSTFLCLYVFIFSWLNIIGLRKHYGSLARSMRGEVLSLVLIVYTFIAVWFVGGLTVFHLYLITTNQTTYENFRYRYSKKENPYNRGVLGNFKELFFSKIPPSMNDFRSWVFQDSYDIHSDSSSSIGLGFSTRNEKIIIDFDSRIEASSLPAPSKQLENFDSSSIDAAMNDESKQVDDDETDPFPFHITHRPQYSCESFGDVHEVMMISASEQGSGALHSDDDDTQQSLN